MRDIVNHDSLSAFITLRYHNCPMDLNRLGNAIRAARKAAGKNQTELGSACGWTDAQTRISNYERGDREPTLADIEAIAKATRLTLLELLTNAFGERQKPRADGNSYKRYPKLTSFVEDLVAHNNEPFINDVIESARVTMEGLAHTRYPKLVARLAKESVKRANKRGKEPPKEPV